jgi:DNA repair protein RadC
VRALGLCVPIAPGVIPVRRRRAGPSEQEDSRKRVSRGLPRERVHGLPVLLSGNRFMSASSLVLASASPDEGLIKDSLVVLPTEEMTEQDLLACLLTSSPSSACASALLQAYPSIGHVITADASQLRAFGLTGRDIATFRLVREIACRMARAQVSSRPVLSNWQSLIGYLKTTMAYEQIEQFRLLFLDRKNNLIADEVQQRGTVNHTPVYPREVMKRALILNASALIVVHNHPSGDPKPSRDDIEMTRELKSAASALEIELHDHVVIGHGTHASFRSLGLL